MSIKYICDVCNKEINLFPGDYTGMLTGTIEGKRFVLIDKHNRKLKHIKRIFHVHDSKCLSKILDVLNYKR